MDELPFLATADQTGIGEHFHVMRDRGGRDAVQADNLAARRILLGRDRLEDAKPRFIGKSLGDFFDLLAIHRPQVV